MPFRNATEGIPYNSKPWDNPRTPHDPYTMPGSEHTRPEMSSEEIRAVFDEARRWGKKTACHVMGRTAIANVLEAGVDVLDHGVYLDEALAERMARAGTYFCPTLSAYDRQTMNPKFQRGEDWARAHSVLVEAHEKSFEVAVRAGVKIVNGTDTTGSYAEELELMRAGGMSAMDTVLACTLNAAEALGMADCIGSIRAGMLADIVLLDANPLDDPYAIEQVYLVIKEGTPHFPGALAVFERPNGV